MPLLPVMLYIAVDVKIAVYLYYMLYIQQDAGCLKAGPLQKQLWKSYLYRTHIDVTAAFQIHATRDANS